jgi:hypothetical protein
LSDPEAASGDEQENNKLIERADSCVQTETISSTEGTNIYDHDVPHLLQQQQQPPQRQQQEQQQQSDEHELNSLFVVKPGNVTVCEGDVVETSCHLNESDLYGMIHSYQIEKRS